MRIFIMSILLVTGGIFHVHGQIDFIPQLSYQFQLQQPKAAFFIPKFDYQKNSIYDARGADIVKSLIIKSPVHYTAFFCKMEAICQKKFGIMIQVHAGDYNSYMDRKIPR